MKEKQKATKKLLKYNNLPACTLCGTGNDDSRLGLVEASSL